MTQLEQARERLADYLLAEKESLHAYSTTKGDRNLIRQKLRDIQAGIKDCKREIDHLMALKNPRTAVSYARFE